MPQDLERARELFLHAVNHLLPEQWDAYLAEACGADDELKRQAAHLLQVHRDAGSFLERPVEGLAATGALARGSQRETAILQPETVGATIGPYKLLELIGEGGMGSVWMAQQTEPVKRLVAIKLIKAGMDSKQVIARFEAERQALALMDHPNIARVLDGGANDAGRPYFVMDLVKGVPITRYCDEHHLTPRQRLELFIPICQAIQHAHQKGIVHRDLKPSNVLVAPYDGRPVVKVIDFGVAKATGQQLTDRTLVTGFGAIVGTLEYMSPEQAELNNHDIDTRSDIYALGVLLYELLTGAVPFSRKDLAHAGVLEMLRVIREQEPSKPSTKLSSAEGLPTLAANRGTEPAKLTKLVRGELDWIVMKALEKDRNRRYETANGFAMDVQRYLADEPVEACPPSARYRLRKFARKHRAALTTSAIFVFLLIAGIVGTTWGMMWAMQSQRREAERAEGERTAKQEALAAAEAEKAARLQAQKRLAQIERGVELFAGMLRGITPRLEEKGGMPLYQQLRQKAEQAAAELNEEVVGDPQAVARLQTVMGNTLRGLGSYATAVVVLEKARATRERELGGDHPDTLITLNGLASAYQDAGRLPEAVPIFEQIRDLRVAKLGADHPSALSSNNNLAGAYQDVGRLPEAIQLYEQVRDGWVAKRGIDHPSTLTSMNNLAGAYLDAGNLLEAIRLYEQIRDARVPKLGAEHPDTLATLSYLAQAYQVAGKLPEAIQSLEKVRDAQVAKLGAEHPDTLTTLHNLAVAYRVAGKLPAAIQLFEKVRDAQVAKLGAEHPDTLRTLNNLAVAKRKTGKLTEAIQMLENVRDVNVTKLGADHPSTLSTLNNLAGAYQDAGRLPEAIRLYEQAAEGMAKRDFLHAYAGPTVHNTVRAYAGDRQFDKAEAWQRRWLAHVGKKAGAKSSAYADELVSLGSLLLKQEKWADSAAILAECLAIREQQQPDAWTTFNTMTMIGGALLGQKQHAQAEPILLKGYEGMKARFEKAQGPDDRRAIQVQLSEAIDWLLRLYEALGKPEEAKKWRQEREALKLSPGK
jgi:serine/threonine protein kinase/tetratricopeptide (TPR) repeat protein